MNREELLNKITNWDEFGRFGKSFHDNTPLRVGCIEGSCARFFAASAEKTLSEGKKMLYIVPNELLAKRAREDLALFLGEGVLMLEHSEYMFYNTAARNEDTEYGRMEVLSRVVAGDFSCLVVPASALIQYVPDPDSFETLQLTLSVGETLDPTELCDRLARMGYARVPTVDGRRQFARRGDIVDIFPTSSENPYRIEFFGDEVDTIRVFDRETQRSVENTERFEILPENEMRMGIRNRTAAAERIQAAWERKAARIENGELRRKLEQEVQSNLTLLREGADFVGMDRYVPFFVGQDYTVFDLRQDWNVFCENREDVLSAVDFINREQLRVCETLQNSLFVPDELYTLYVQESEIRRLLGRIRPVYLEKYAWENPEKPEPWEFRFQMKLLSGTMGNDALLQDMLSDWSEKGYEVILAASREERCAGMRDLLRDRVDAYRVETWAAGDPEQGFACDSLGFVLAGESTFFVGGRRRSTNPKKKKRGDIINVFSDIQPGDYVVHDVHGVGIFEGVQSKEFEGIMKDYVVISYAAGGKLFLPSFQLDSIHKYIGGEDTVPRINRLGGKDWQAEKEKVRNSLRDYVEELAVLYAKRQQQEGFAFSPDQPWQRDFEQEFAYEPTQDQLDCIAEIKNDMERPHPMERLLCGDVGFGKTEVALRAAFKAVMDGKQVAILVPTTVLAQQHYRTAKERFRNFPVRVDYVCRFRTAKEKKQIQEDLKEGKIDVLIGTHGLVMGKMEFKDLGLIIVDEEQRFGVLQKEKLKMEHPACDLLYLSATPIPRTLNMSLSNFRDISLITEPPKSRNPVQTYVVEMNRDMIRNAIYREISRGGQVFYLYNQVNSIGERLKTLSELVPEARICVGHGQMPERELEQVMADFIAGEYDVLLCSTIIESGLDIPNANTMIVENGHRLGLAQLYQIRGRVGRSDSRAYAYITYPSRGILNEDAVKRLETIKEFTEFGSGFKVAMRDLEIRGAGTLLGERQHGEVSSVGFDMYTRMLNDMITEVTGGQVKREVTVNVDFQVSSYIPGSYVSDPDTRLELYRKLAAVENDEDISDLIDELVDRFPGDVPEILITLMHLSKIKALAGVCGIQAVNQKREKVEFSVAFPDVFDACIKRNFAKINGDYKRRFTIMAGEKRICGELRLSGPGVLLQPPICLLKEVEAFLEMMAG